MIRTDCTIKKPSKPNDQARLCWEPDCRKPLPKSARKWCSGHGGRFQIWLRNHKWWAAREFALMAACVSDHPKAKAAIEKWGARNDGLGLHAYYNDPCDYPCAICKEPIGGSPEVDHKAPMNGDDRDTADCRNHETNLRVLCHKCHAGVTRRQAFGRAADRRGQGVLINL